MNQSKFNFITTFIFDVDGVFTNSEVISMENGDHIRIMNTRDGQAVKIAMEAGYNVAVITKGFSAGVRRRFEFLGVPFIYDQLNEKSQAFNEYQSKLNLKKEEILFMGDDIPDLVLYDLVGISSCPSDAANENLSKAMYISPIKGGQGCVREIIERVLRIQGKWNF
ncbi:MAG: 3-deoxy-D-manno-octulosonate 8-phosphate phosphatase [Saprospiraceae bacterium]|jgi:3-deoxy-D-manno-octulosonate 8-phosphate phosphatase (KDO 8-P phosphatase)|nr:3-deoxy-D-manno-octulosonate 8-phosphate phosphatase [Saprospiraceae bacterium]MBL0027234.1 3-deoxy-D-manno-octulosonate 8-phosphate phosphatase [Saprospiraceae bacterium]